MRHAFDLRCRPKAQPTPCISKSPPGCHRLPAARPVHRGALETQRRFGAAFPARGRCARRHPPRSDRRSGRRRERRVPRVPVPADALAVGDLFLVRPGEKVATDGVVVEGAAAVDVERADRRVRARRRRPGRRRRRRGRSSAAARSSFARRAIGADTQLARMARIVEEAQLGIVPRPAARRPRLPRSSCRSCSRSPW